MNKVFNNKNAVIEGWYWALPSDALSRGEVAPVFHMGRELALYRGQDGRVAALDAYCRHMGAHLAEGRVEGNELRCFFHHWKYDRSGRCVDIPCLSACPPERAKTNSWPVAEKYGLIWVWTGKTPRHPVPFVPELEDQEIDSALGKPYFKNCHPNVVMINAIDEQHFASVHDLPVKLYMETRPVNENCIGFANTTKVPDTTFLTRFISRFYNGALTYAMSYWYASTGSVTLGPDFLHCHILFALRRDKEGRTEGQTILVTRKRKGPLGWLFNRVILWATKLVGNYFAHGDTKIFQTIRFDLKTPLAADHAILDFIRHTEAQPLAQSWSQTLPAGIPRGDARNQGADVVPVSVFEPINV